MTRKQLALLFSYFDEKVEDDLIKFETQRLVDNIDLPTLNYMTFKVHNAIEPQMSVGKYFYTIANLANVQNSTFKLIAERHTGDWEKEKKGLIAMTNPLLDSLGLPTFDDH